MVFILIFLIYLRILKGKAINENTHKILSNEKSLKIKCFILDKTNLMTAIRSSDCIRLNSEIRDRCTDQDIRKGIHLFASFQKIIFLALNIFQLANSPHNHLSIFIFNSHCNL